MKQRISDIRPMKVDPSVVAPGDYVFDDLDELWREIREIKFCRTPTEYYCFYYDSGYNMYFADEKVSVKIPRKKVI